MSFYTQMCAMLPSLLGPALLSLLQHPTTAQSLWAALPSLQEEHQDDLARAPSLVPVSPPETPAPSSAEFLSGPSQEKPDKSTVVVNEVAHVSFPAPPSAPFVSPPVAMSGPYLFLLFSWCDLSQSWEDNTLVTWCLDDISD